MQVKIFSDENWGKLEKAVNAFLKGLPNEDVVKVEAFPLTVASGSIRIDQVVVCVWLKTDSREA